MKKKSSKNPPEGFEPTKVALAVATLAGVSLVLFALLGVRS